MADARNLRLPSDASEDEAAAITAAVEQWLAAEALADDGQAGAEPWDGKRFAFAGRVAKLAGEPVRVPDGAPADPWTAVGRLERR